MRIPSDNQPRLVRAENSENPDRSVPCYNRTPEKPAEVQAPGAMSYQIHTYAELRQQIHDDLRLQHPDWIQPDGKSPICDSYEARLMELLEHSTPGLSLRGRTS